MHSLPPLLPPDVQQRIEQILFRGDPSDGVAALCAAHPAHESAIRAWLAALERAEVDHQATDLPRIANYRVLDRLGRGGFGEVFLAEQEEPVRRRVALKVLKLGMDSKSILARFAREQEALARMNHDAIAKIYDAGMSSSGQPFFAMEVVDGEPITTHCDRHELSLRNRLELFTKVCLGVHHAHQKGVVHRDLKPGNVLVATVGGTDTPKLIDFGIARALQPEGDAAVLTETGMLLGSPGYMAPEQALGDLSQIDTRTDVYALGAILFEMLTGTGPLGSGKDQASSPWEMRQRLLSTGPRRPSSSTPPTGIAATWQRQLKHDLDWIVLRAMAREPERRYASAAELADDVQRHLREEPVLAGPPSTSYRLRKFVRRNRMQVTAASLVFATAIVGAGVAWQLALEADAQARLASIAAEDAMTQKAVAELHATKAEAEATRATAAERDALRRKEQIDAVARFQSRQMQSVVPSRVGGDIVRELLRGYSARLATLPPEQAATMPASEDLRRCLEALNATNVARTILDQNLLAPTIETLPQAFPNEPGVQTTILHGVAETALQMGLLERATTTLARVHELSADADETDPARDEAQQMLEVQMLTATGRFADAELAARHLFTEVDGRYGAEAEVTRSALSMLAQALMANGRHTEAAELVASRLSPATFASLRHPRDLMSAMTYGQALRRLGDLPAALQAYRDTVAAAQAIHGEEHPHAIAALANLASLTGAMGDRAEAEPMARRCLELRRRLLGDEHPETLVSINNLAILCEQRGELAEALRLHQQNLTVKQRTLGDVHPSTLVTQQNIGSVLFNMGRYREAMPWIRSVSDARNVQLTAGHPSRLSIESLLVRNSIRCGDLATAESQAESAMQVRHAVRDGRVGQRDIAFEMAHLLLTRGFVERAEDWLARGKEVLQRDLADGIDHAGARMVLVVQAGIAAVRGDAEAAEAAYRQALADPVPGLWTSLARTGLLGLMASMDRPEAALQLAQEEHDWNMAKLGPDAEPTVASGHSQALLLARLGRHEAARELWDVAARHVGTTFGEHHEIAFLIGLGKARSLLTSKRVGEGEDALRAAIAVGDTALGRNHRDVQDAVVDLATSMHTRGSHAELLQLTAERTAATAAWRDNPSALCRLRTYELRALQDSRQMGAACQLASELHRQIEKGELAPAATWRAFAEAAIGLHSQLVAESDPLADPSELSSWRRIRGDD